MLLVDRRIIGWELARDINAAIGAEIARALTSRGGVDLSKHNQDHHHHHHHHHHHQDQDQDNDNDQDNGYDIPEWVADRVNDFVLSVGMYPFVKEKTPPPPPPLQLDHGIGINKRLVGVAIAGRGAALRSVAKDRDRDRDREMDGVVKEGGEEEYTGYAVAKWTDRSPEEVAVRVQEFYGALEREVRDRRRRARGESSAAREGRERGEQEDRETDAVVGRVVEAVESVLSCLFYDRCVLRLFRILGTG